MSHTVSPEDPLARLRTLGLLPRPPYAFPALPIPWRIVVVSSPPSAGYADFAAVLDGVAGITLRLIPTALHDPLAVSHAIAAAGHDTGATALAVVRGGGDGLDVFNAWPVLYALADAPHFTVLGVGHASDTVLAGQAVDHEAITPTAAAAFLAAQRRDCPVRP